MWKKALKTFALALINGDNNQNSFLCVSENGVTEWNEQISAEFKVM